MIILCFLNLVHSSGTWHTVGIPCATIFFFKKQINFIFVNTYEYSEYTMCQKNRVKEFQFHNREKFKDEKLNRRWNSA